MVTWAVTTCSEAWLLVTVKVALPFSGIVDGLADICSVGTASLSVMVRVWVVVPLATAPVGVPRLRTTVSSTSLMASPWTWIWMAA